MDLNILLNQLVKQFEDNAKDATESFHFFSGAAHGLRELASRASSQAAADQEIEQNVSEDTKPKRGKTSRKASTASSKT